MPEYRELDSETAAKYAQVLYAAETTMAQDEWRKRRREVLTNLDSIRVKAIEAENALDAGGLEPGSPEWSRVARGIERLWTEYGDESRRLGNLFSTSYPGYGSALRTSFEKYEASR